jgi:hypothetical protein
LYQCIRIEFDCTQFVLYHYILPPHFIVTFNATGIITDISIKVAERKKILTFFIHSIIRMTAITNFFFLQLPMWFLTFNEYHRGTCSIKSEVYRMWCHIDHPPCCTTRHCQIVCTKIQILCTKRGKPNICYFGL